MSVFRFPADRIPVAIFTSLTLLDFVIYFTIETPWLLMGYWLLMMPPKGIISAWNHHHQHTKTFNSVLLNRILETIYALHTGITANLWVLHHVLGHHHNFLDQRLDQSRWKRNSGKTMGLIEYSLTVAATAYWRGFKVGQKHPKPQKVFIKHSLFVFALVLALLVYNPVAALFIFVLPMICSLIFTAAVTYEHHVDLDTDNQFEGSYNVMNPLYNKLFGNLGYHTAHHYKQGVHWSELPTLHNTIKDKIPEHLYISGLFGMPFLK